MYALLRPWLFALSPEFSHDLTLSLLKGLSWLKQNSQITPKYPHPKTVMGLTFANPVGLAAGLDKNAVALKAWESMGFGFIEVGTVTPRPQAGNPKPRLFRLTEDQAVINRMGFNNAGLAPLLERISHVNLQVPLGINIGKNRDTSLENASQDYSQLYEAVYPYADYVTVNLSSPNTPGLRELQWGDELRKIVGPLKEIQARLQGSQQKKVPLLVKIAPDLNAESLGHLVSDLLQFEIEGIIATNTTVARADHLKSSQQHQAGGLSGAPLTPSAQHIMRELKQLVGNKMALIGVGGIMTPEDAKARLAAGADLVQLYSGFIYQGPRLIADIIKVLQAPV